MLLTMGKMAKYKKSPGTWFEREMFESMAYLSLRGFAPQLLVLVLAKRQFVSYEKKVGKKKEFVRIAIALILLTRSLKINMGLHSRG